MHVKHHWDSAAHTVVFHIQLSEPEQPAVYNSPRYGARLAQPSFRILLPDRIAHFDDVHPDVWGLIVLLALFPFVKTELHMSFAVSSGFAECYRAATAKDVLPVNPTLVPHTSTPAAAHASVAFNGRVHSFTTAVVLGGATRLVAMDHWDSMRGERASPYPSDALYSALDTMESQGYRVCMVKTDVQSLYEPFGFVHPLSSIIGNLLLADALQLSSVHLGCHLDDVYTLGSYTVRAKKDPNANANASRIRVDRDAGTLVNQVSFKNQSLALCPSKKETRPEHTVAFWRQMLAVVDLKLDFPLCGVTDALLVRLLHEHRMWAGAHYCLYCRPQKKCGSCTECLYYDSVHNSITKGDAPPVFEKIWNRFADQYPEATAGIHDFGSPNRWHFFWLEMVRRKDMLPAGKVFDMLGAYSGVYHEKKFVVKNATHILEEAHADKVHRGLHRLLSAM
jgi:hypothetical protein